MSTDSELEPSRFGVDEKQAFRLQSQATDESTIREMVAEIEKKTSIDVSKLSVVEECLRVDSR